MDNENENESANTTMYSFTVDDGSVQLPDVNIETANSTVDVTEDLKADQALQSKDERSISTGDNSNVEGNDGSGKEKIGGEEGREKQNQISGSSSSEESDE